MFFGATGCCSLRTSSAGLARTSPSSPKGSLPDGRRRVADRGGHVRCRHHRQDHRRGRGDAADRAGSDPGRRPSERSRDGGSQAGGLLLVDLLRFAGGSVDDGKSTLIGRLLYDSKAIFTDQLESVERTSRERDEYRPRPAHRRPAGRARAGHHHRRRLSVLRDAAAEVHHRRHAEASSTRNMVTAPPRPTSPSCSSTPARASSSKSRRHAFLVSLSACPAPGARDQQDGLGRLVENVFEQIADEFTNFAAKLDIADLTIIPISALNGDNIVSRSDRMPWYEGPSLLHHPGARAHRQ